MFSSLNFLFRRSVKHYDKIIFLDFDGVLAINNPRLCDVPKRDRHGIVIDTIRNDSIDRSIKIDSWLKKYKVTKYVIIDDMDFHQFDKHHHQHLVTTSPLTGLSESDIVRVCMTLKK